MHNRLALGLIITAMFAMTANASLQMYLDKSFTVPGTNPISQLQFADWDRDGIPEVAALSIDSVVIYSITGDSIILAYRNDSIPANPVSILFADVTRDSIPDLVLQYSGLFTLVGKSVDVILELHDGSQDFAVTKRSTHTTGPPWTISSDNSVVLQVIRGYSDYNELCLSFKDTILYDPWIYGYDLDLRYRISTYDSLPDELDRVGGNQSSIYQVPGYDAVIAERGVYISTFTGPGADYFRQFDFLSIFTYSHKSSAQTLSSLLSCDCYGDENNTSYSSLRLAVAGDFLGSDGKVDYINAWNWQQSCSSMDSTAIYCSGSGITCATIDASGGSTINWSKPISSFNSEWPISQLPFFPNHLATAGYGKVVIISATTGEVADSCVGPSTYNRRWDYPYSDNHLRLVTIDGRKVELWGFDEATGVVDPPIAILPQRFELSNPYPNPFNPSVTINLAIPTKGRVRLDVFNLTGHRVATICNDVVLAGTKTFQWDAAGHASGVYFFRATFEEQSKTVKAVLLK